MAKLGVMVDGSPGCRFARLTGGEVSMSLQVAGSPGCQVSR